MAKPVPATTPSIATLRQRGGPVQPPAAKVDPLPEPAPILEVTAEATLLERACADPLGALTVFDAIVAGRIKLAGPWRGGARQTRTNPTGTVVGEVAHRGGGNYNAFVEGESVGPKMMDETQAKTFVDATLRSLGYGLAE